MKFSKIDIKSNITTLKNGFSNQPAKYLLITLIVLITVVKLGLIGKGSMAYPDELRYISSGKALQKLSQLKIPAALNDVFLTQGRPADAIIKTIPTIMQFVTAHIFKLNYYESNNSYCLFIFNFIIYCLILIVHFKFSKLLLKDTFLAVMSVLFYCCLTNSYLYLRHALPYDESLLIFYLIVYHVIKLTNNNSLTFKNSSFLGFSSFLGYLVYPGYFPLFIVGLFLLFFNNFSFKNILPKIYHSIFYILGALICLIIFEVLSRIGGHSYLNEASRLSGTVVQGSFEESFTFILKYLFEVEGLSGIILLVSLTAFYLLIAYQLINKKFNQHANIILLSFALIGLFLAYASAGYFLHKMVFYGRLLHQYIPFICILSLFAINEFTKNLKRNQYYLLIIAVVFVTNFGINFKNYLTFSYPRDMAWELSKTNNLRVVENVFEYDSSWSVLPSEKEFTVLNTNYNNQINGALLVNCCYIYPLSDVSLYHKFDTKGNYDLIKSESHFINFKAYQYEGYNIEERQNIDRFKFKIALFSKKTNLELKP